MSAARVLHAKTAHPTASDRSAARGHQRTPFGRSAPIGRQPVWPKDLDFRLEEMGLNGSLIQEGRDEPVSGRMLHVC